MANHFDGPPALIGEDRQNLEAIYRYLQTMSDQLNMAMNSMTIENFAPSTQKQLSSAISGDETQKEITGTKNALRSMIIKSAEIVKTEMQEISTELKGQYQAMSKQFGELDQKLSLQIDANARGIQQNYEYFEQLTGRADGTDDYIKHYNNYIFMGQIGLREDTLEPVYGLAIGEGVTQYDDHGNPYLNNNAKVATFTKDRLSFWQGATEMAYFSDKKLYITDVEILSKMTMGNYVWKIQADGSMGLMVQHQTNS